MSGFSTCSKSFHFLGKNCKHQSDFNKTSENKEIIRLSGRFIVTGICMYEALKISKKTSKILKSDFQWVAVLNRLKTKLTSGKSGNAQVKCQYFNLKTLPYIMWDSQTSVQHSLSQRGHLSQERFMWVAMEEENTSLLNNRSWWLTKENSRTP